MPTDPDCVFCKIVGGQIPAATVLQTEAAVAFLDIAPVTPGHLLLVSKEHYATLGDTPPEVLSQLVGELPRLSRAVLAATGAKAMNLIQNNGREAGQEVPHLHFHLIPRLSRDEFRIHWPRGSAQGEELERMRAAIAAAMSPEQNVTG